MNIPTFLNVQYVQGDGYLTPQMQLYNDELNSSMQSALSDSGWTIPNLDTAQITSIADQMPDGTIWFNTDLKKLVVKTDTDPSVIETIQSV